MSPSVSNLIRARVDRYNAREVEQECQAELSLAYAAGDLSDIEALRGKIGVCREVQNEDVVEGRISLADLLWTFGMEP